MKALKSRIILILVKVASKIINWLQKLIDKTKTKTPKPICLETLTPTTNADKDDVYKSALKNAIDNPKNLNIGITGAYGAGKSSILESFKKTYCSEYKFLSISLASFNENNLWDSEIKKDGTSPNGNQPNNNHTPIDDDTKHKTNQLIELSILQQLLYHVKIKELPNSRFNRIKRNNIINLYVLPILIFLWLLSLILIIEPSFIKSTTLWSHLDWKNNGDSITNFCFIFFSIGCFFISYNLVRFAQNSRLSKLNLKDGEIVIDCPNDQSILNRYLDEIFYFFEETKHNVVIIEDLDRFKNSMIFTKLRELNNLLNNSDQIKKSVGRIVFIYALRDDMFKDKSRTKFFDVIIPVIPIVNTTNSGDMFLKLMKESDPSHPLSAEFISDISLFIDDMRLLKNIYNEYQIYKNKITRVPDPNKLLAMIVYKNIFPAGFVDLHNGKGIIYRVLKSEKSKLIEDFIKEIDNQLEAFNLQIKEIQNLIIDNERELRSVYINTLWNKLPQGLSQITVNGSNYYYNQLSEDEIFNKLIGFGANVRPNNYPGKIISFKELENEVNSKLTYNDRLSYCRQKGEKEIDLLKKDVENLNEERNVIRSKSIEQISQKKNIASTFIELKEPKYSLIHYLLRKGYIDEDYEFYISFFHEGSLTSDDRNFLLSIKELAALDFRFKLNNIKEIITRLRTSEFEQTEILNINLLDFLILNKREYFRQLGIYLNLLSDETTRSTEFIDIYINEGKYIPYFIEQLTNRWPGIWNYIEIISNYSTEHKDKYLELIIRYAKLSDIEKLNGGSQFSSYIGNKSNFLSLIPYNTIDKAKSIIENLGIIFNSIENPKANTQLFDIIYKDSHYELNQYMIELIVKEKGTPIENLSELLKKQNFTIIRTTNCQPLMTYVYGNIVDYVENVLLQLEDNTEENEESLIELLNDPALDITLKEKIIIKINTKISDISKIEDTVLFPIIAEHSKILPIWENVYKYLETEDETGNTKKLKPLDSSIIKFLNEDVNYLELAKNKLNCTNEEYEIEFDLSNKIILCSDLNILAFLSLLNCVPYKYKFLPCKNISTKKVSFLIDGGKLNPTVENYNYLKENFDNLHIHLIETRADEFIENLFQFTIDSTDALSILQSESFTNKQKISLIKSFDKVFIENKKELCTLICEILAGSSYIDLSLEFLQTLFKYCINVNATIKLFNLHLGQKKLDHNSITTLLSALGGSYVIITNKGQRPNLNNTYENLKLAEHLEAMNYISSKKIKGDRIKINTKTK